MTDRLKEESFDEMVAKYGNAKARKINKLKEIYQAMLSLDGHHRWSIRKVERYCAHIHALWVGIMYPLPESKLKLLHEYHDLDGTVQWYDFLELCWAWKRAWPNIPYPNEFVVYCERQKYWFTSDMP